MSRIDEEFDPLGASAGGPGLAGPDFDGPDPDIAAGVSNLGLDRADQITGTKPIDEIPVYQSAPLQDSSENSIELKEVEGLSQGRIVLRRFLRHRGAMISTIVLLLMLLLVTTSVGWGPIPGWWRFNFRDINPVVNPMGAPTMGFHDGRFMFGDHPFGQDNVGRDVFAMVMRGTQQSLTVMTIIGLTSSIFGILVGAFSGFFGGRVDDIIMRLTDMVITIPTIMIGAILGRMVGGANAWSLAFVLSFVTWTTMARLVRSQFLALREREFVDAARVAGASNFRIMFKHILPNAIGVMIVNATLLMASAILLETALSYLGFGIQAPEVSLGQIINEYQAAFQTRPWLFWWPGAFIVTIALCVNFIGDGLRDAFDPRQRRIPTKRALAKADAKAAKATDVVTEVVEVPATVGV